MKRKFLLAILAVVPAVFMPLAATSQIAPDRAPRTEPAEPSYKYQVFAGYGYTSLNQVNQSRFGLMGPDISLTRDWGRFFGITADGAFYRYPLGRPAIQNSTLTASMDAVLIGPVLHANLFRHYDAFFHVLLGAEHVGGVNAYPDLSFAGGVGVGIDYKLNSHFSLRASGDDIASSFVAPIYLANPAPPIPPPPAGTCTTTSDCSPHRRRSSRAAFGLVYKF